MINHVYSQRIIVLCFNAYKLTQLLINGDLDIIFALPLTPTIIIATSANLDKMGISRPLLTIILLLLNLNSVQNALITFLNYITLSGGYIMKLTNMKLILSIGMLLTTCTSVYPMLDMSQVKAIAIDETHLEGFHQDALKLLVACFVEVNNFKQPITEFINEICTIVENNVEYFKEKCPTVNFTQFMIDLRSIEPGQSAFSLKTKLDPYWDLLPKKVQDLGLKLGINARRRLAIK